MRMRRKKNGPQRMEQCGSLVVRQAQEQKGKWAQMFDNDHPLQLEIGCGKGRFILGMAQAHPEVNFIAMERNLDVLLLAAEKCRDGAVRNVRLFGSNASQLPLLFEKGEVERLYLNFSDPWPKSRHAKRRLTHPNFLALYKEILEPGAQIHFKTDNLGLFEYSLHTFPEEGFALRNITYDLHNSGFEGNVMTEYETHFSSLGQPIYRLEAIV